MQNTYFENVPRHNSRHPHSPRGNPPLAGTFSLFFFSIFLSAWQSPRSAPCPSSLTAPAGSPLRPRLHKALSQHESTTSTGAERQLPPAAPLPLNNPSLISAVTRKHVVFPSLKKKKGDTHCQIYWLEYFNLKINKGGKHWSKRRISGFQAIIKQQRTKLKRPACQQGEAQHWELPILCLHHLKRGWEAGIDVSQWTEPYLKAKQVSVRQLNAALISSRHRFRSTFDFICCKNRKHADPFLASDTLDE